MTNYPRKPNSGKQAGRKNLPGWLRHAVDESEEEGFECGAGVFFACEAYYAARRGVDLPVAQPAPDDELTDEQVAAATERFRNRLRRMRRT
jgi:hypothetical protein